MGHDDWAPDKNGQGMRCQTCMHRAFRRNAAKQTAAIAAARRALGLSWKDYTEKYGFSRRVAEGLLMSGDDDD